MYEVAVANGAPIKEFSIESEIEEICHVTAADILINTANSVWLVSLESEHNSVIAKFEPSNDNSSRQIHFVLSNGGDKVYIYDSEEVLYLWNPHTRQTLARSLIQKV